MFCISCGKKINKVGFCPYCGKSQNVKTKIIIDNKIKKLLKDNISKIHIPSFLKKIKLTYFFYSIITILFFSITILFLLPSSSSSSNILLIYTQSFLQTIKSVNLVSVLGLIFLILFPTIFFIIKDLKKNKLLKIKSLIKIVLINFIIIFISFYLALLITSVFSLVTTINFSKKLNKSPETLNVILDIDSIVKKLDSTKIVPKVIEANRENLSEIVVSRHQNTKFSPFYSKNLISSVTGLNPIKPVVITQGLIMVDNDLVFFELKKEELEKISPYLGFSLTKKFFNPRDIKSYPELRVLNRQEYIKVRDDQINVQINALDYLIDLIKTDINQNLSDISEDKSKISSNESGLADSISSKDTSYKTCISAGYYSYYFNTFYRYYSDDQCRNKSNEWDEIIAKWQKNISDWKNNLSYDQSLLNENKIYLTYFSNWKKNIEAQKSSTPLELGVFYDDKKIDIAFDWTNNKSIISFLETLSHEYLHYSSYISNEKSFGMICFEEGLTEYYARSIIKDNYNKDTNIGYPLLTKVMSQIFNKLPKKELEEIYFTKNEDGLISLLDSTFGKDFYKKNEIIFFSLPYLYDKEGIDIANKLIKSIGGEMVTEKDLEGEIR